MEADKIYIEKHCKGLHRFCNWVVYLDALEKGRILMSSYTYQVHIKKIALSQHPKKNDFYKQKPFLEGVTYICLQEKKEVERLDLPVYYSKKQLNIAQKKLKSNMSNMTMI
jgi:hypothetical protein